MHARDLPSNAKETATSVKVQIIGCEVVWSCQTKSSIVELFQKGLAPSMPNISIEGQFCQVCTLGKHNRKKASKTSLHRMKAPFDLVHTDVCGPLNNTSLSGVCYILTFTDDCRRFGWVFFLKKKSVFFFSIQAVYGED
jgi:hypothetical protein